MSEYPDELVERMVEYVRTCSSLTEGGWDRPGALALLSEIEKHKPVDPLAGQVASCMMACDPEGLGGDTKAYEPFAEALILELPKHGLTIRPKRSEEELLEEAREAAAQYWDSIDPEISRGVRSGEADNRMSVQSALIALSNREQADASSNSSRETGE